jgi:hypothetical protein
MAEQSFMARFGPHLVANGYSVIPIQPGSKKPGRFSRDAWRDYPDWTRHAMRATTDQELTIWSTWPDAGVGVVAGRVAGLDIDMDTDPELALKIENLARQRLGDTRALRIGKPPKRLLVYRTTDVFRGIKRAPIEVLCLGQQFVAYAIHPATGRPYDWPEEQLADLDIESLPAIAGEQASLFLDEAIELIPQHLRPNRLQNGRGGAAACAIALHGQQGTGEAIRAALTYIPNADLDYDSWVRIGMALKGALGETGEGLFAAWSAQSAKNEAEATAKAWASFSPREIGAGSIYHLAMERGWRPEPSLVLDGSAPRNAVHPAAGLLAKIDPETVEAPPTPPPPPPPSLERLDGALKLMVDYVLATAIRPQPWLAVGAALTALGALMGRKVRTETNLRSNLYVIAIAESGGGKDHARKAIKEAFFAAGLSRHLGGERIASGAGLITALVREPSSLFQIDEFGKFLSNIVDKRRAPKHLSEIWDLFTELATSAGSTFFGAEYADQRERPRNDIIEPCCSIHGTTAPGPFWETLKSPSLQDGSLARFLVFRSDHDIPDRNRRPGPLSNVPPELIEALQQVASVGAGAPACGNLQGVTAPSIKPAPIIVPMDAEALILFDALDDEMTGRQRDAIGSNASAVLARVWENTAKVALVKAVSANAVSPVIRGEDAAWACDVVAHCVATLLLQAERHLADNETERNHKRVLEIIRGAGMSGIPKKQLYDRTRFLGRRDREDILLTLIESETIVRVQRQTGGRPIVLFRVLG